MAEQLKKGSTLLWYRIDSILGRGGFGITYLATDTNLETRVAIKEYLPGDIAERKQDSYIIPKTGTDGEMYRWGLTRFIEEARILAKFKHHNIVRVNSVFEENNTAYMVMEYEHGNNLDLMLRTPNFQSEERLVEIFDAILSGLEQVHAHNIIHRDIKPANIYIREDGSPVLLDFGSARQHVADRSQNMTRILTKGYAPYEQMDDSGNARQGPWTDIYAIGATLYYAISRQLPTDCLSRFTRVIQKQPDPLKPARELETEGEYSPEFLFAIDQALQFEGADRPQNVGEFRQLLRAGLNNHTSQEQAPVTPVTDDPDATVIAIPSQKIRPSIPLDSERTRFSEDLTPPSHSGRQSYSEPAAAVGLTGDTGAQKASQSRLPIIAGIAVLVAALGLGGGYFLLKNPASQGSDSNVLTEQDILRLEQQAALRKQAEAEQKRLEKERAAAAERQRIEQEQAEKQAEAERLRLEQERKEQRAQAERERLAKEQAEAERAQREQERLAREREQKRLEEEANRLKLAEIKRLEQLKQEEERRQKALEEEQAKAERERIAAEEKLQQEQARLEALRKIEEEEKARLARLEAEEKAAAQKAEAERLERERAAAEQLKREQELAARKKAEAEKAAADRSLAQKKSNTTSSSATKVTRVAKKKPSVNVLIEQQKQANESDMQSISRLFNDFRTHLASCDVKTLKSTSKAQKDSASFVSSLCGEYKNMEISIRNFQSNVRRGVASADVTIQKLTSKSGDTVLPSRNWNTLSIKTKKSKEGFWEFVEW